MDKRIQTILCAIDLSDYSAHVISWGRDLAKQCRASLVVFHAVPPSRERLDRVASCSGDQVLHRAEGTIARLMESIDVPWKWRVVEGEPAAALVKAVRETRADLIIAASLGFSGFKRAFVGSVVERMVRHSEKPFLVMRCREHPEHPDKGPDIRKIAVACDFPACFPAQQAAEFAAILDADLDAVHCAVSPAEAETREYPDCYQSMQAKFEQHIREQILAALSNEKQLRPGRIFVTVLEGNPGETIIGFARANQCDLVVTGVRPRTILGRLLTGSTTETLIRQAPCHVLAIPKTGENRAGRKTKPTGVVMDPRFLDHDTPAGHPETPERLAMINDLVTGLKTGLGLTVIPPVPAAKEDILRVHTPRYFEQVAATQYREQTWLTPDTMASPKTFQTALLACGAVITAIRAAAAGTIENGAVFVRPPGHHAEQGRAMGYCIFNNVAVGAMYARTVLGLPRVLIVDFDVHHGNGTCHIFERDPTVMFFSTHQYPLFPGTGLFTETGLGPGEGYSINIPLSKGFGEAEFTAIFMKILKPVAREFKPDLILVSAGFDIHKSDPLGKMKVTSRGFGPITASIMDIAKENRAMLIFVLEGGYHITALAKSVETMLRVLCGATIPEYPEVAAAADPKKVNPVMHRCRYVHGAFWKEVAQVC
ncbi:MAG: universal stress protein [Desulfotignum sp.]|nr:universal stress protein [Desulfotignum sp.]MCF8088813.1 universal stress protein [Desulfotignum sp.]MCF8137693.1 universal stress protein [Desulfotignum sp.]